jgi:hypothetical protein
MFRITLIGILCCSIVGLIVGSLLDDARAKNSDTVPLLTAKVAGTQTPKTLCERNEQVVFSCTMQKSTKLLSICTSKQIDSKNGYVQYRFGLPDKVELEFPTERKDTQSAFRYSRYTRPLVTLLTLQFESNGYKYLIHQDSNAEEKPPVNASYLNITTPDANAKEIEMTCREPVKGSLMLLEDVVPRSEE